MSTYGTEWEGFCGGTDCFGDCIVESLGLLFPYYLFLVIFLPVRAYEIRLLPPSYPPQWWPLSHTVKRISSASIAVSLLVSLFLSILSGDIKPYALLSLVVRSGSWLAAYWILALEYKRYQPITWVGLRGFWFLTGIEGALRITWNATYSQSSTTVWILSVMVCI